MTSTNGIGYNLEEKAIDKKLGKVFMVKQCDNKDAIEVEVTKNDALKVISGHHTLGFTLDLWDGIKKKGNQLSFSEWDERGKNIQINWKKMTISPLGESSLVVGWKDGKLQLVSDESSNQIYFCPFNPKDSYTISLSKDEKCQDNIDQTGY